MGICDHHDNCKDQHDDHHPQDDDDDDDTDYDDDDVDDDDDDDDDDHLLLGDKVDPLIDFAEAASSNLSRHFPSLLIIITIIII